MISLLEKPKEKIKMKDEEKQDYTQVQARLLAKHLIECENRRKEKQIEEMAKELKKMIKEVVHDIEDYSWKDIAKELYKIIIYEDSVVLSREKYERLKKASKINTQIKSTVFEGLYMSHFDIAELKAKERKETAEKILDLVYDYGQDYFVEEKYMKENDFNQMLNKLKQEVEIKE